MMTPFPRRIMLTLLLRYRFCVKHRLCSLVSHYDALSTSITGMAMKKLTLLTLAFASFALLGSCGAKQETPNPDALAQQTTNAVAPSDAPAAAAPSAAPAAAAPAANDGIFKYTIKTDFVTTDIDSNTENIEILVAINSVEGQFPVKYDLDCEGDGDFEYKGLTNNQKCIYKKDSGKHQIWLRGEIPAMVLCQREKSPECEKRAICPDDSKNAVISIDSWGNVPWKSMAMFAANCYALNKLPEDSPDLRQVKDMSHMFDGAISFNQSLEAWNVSNVINMSNMFAYTHWFNQPLEKWNVSNVTDMNAMFMGARLFNQPLEKWNVSNVTNMNVMFMAASSFNQPLEKWDVSNVTDMSGMFMGARLFNQPLDKWDVSKVTTMHDMFQGAESFNQPIGNWNVKNVRDMDGMLGGTPYMYKQPKP